MRSNPDCIWPGGCIQPCPEDPKRCTDILGTCIDTCMADDNAMARLAAAALKTEIETLTTAAKAELLRELRA